MGAHGLTGNVSQLPLQLGRAMRPVLPAGRQEEVLWLKVVVGMRAALLPPTLSPHPAQDWGTPGVEPPDEGSLGFPSNVLEVNGLSRSSTPGSGHPAGWWSLILPVPGQGVSGVLLGAVLPTV